MVHFEGNESDNMEECLQAEERESDDDNNADDLGDEERIVGYGDADRHGCWHRTVSWFRSKQLLLLLLLFDHHKRPRMIQRYACAHDGTDNDGADSKPHAGTHSHNVTLMLLLCHVFKPSLATSQGLISCGPQLMFGV